MVFFRNQNARYAGTRCIMNDKFFHDVFDKFFDKFFDKVFDVFLTKFLTSNFSTVASFRIGVPSIMF